MKTGILALVLVTVLAGCRSSALKEEIAATREARDVLASIRTKDDLDRAQARVDASLARLRAAQQEVATEVAREGKALGTAEQRDELQAASNDFGIEQARVAFLRNDGHPISTVAPLPVRAPRRAPLPDPPKCERDCTFDTVREQTEATRACHVVLEWIKTPSDATSALQKVKDCTERVKVAQSAAASALNSGMVAADQLAELRDARADVEEDLWHLAEMKGHGAEVNAVGYELLMVGFAPRKRGSDATR